jgi:pyruvate/2-oxoglutarate dehydrogenase complex dihydrolipoamide acyltransferase (E2) component
MPTPLHTPRVNNNDDSVRLVRILVKPGDPVRAGDIVAEVETDKANFTVESDQDGYVLAVAQELRQTIDVGSVLLWLGATPDEAPPATSSTTEQMTGPVVPAPTLKAAQVLAKHGLSASEVPATGERLTVRDVEAFLASRASPTGDAAGHGTAATAAPAAIGPGRTRPLTPEERAMLRTVIWQRDEAVPAYVELQYDVTAWEKVAAEYQKRERLLVNPLLALMAYRLARLAAQDEGWNSTIIGDERHVYSTVNLGFTIQSDTTLYLAVVHDAATLTCREFVDRLGSIQRGAIGHKLRATELTGATISFSSMARWNVGRHVPVLPPYTALIAAHAGTSNGVATLGATYDHRVLTGFDALTAIQAVAVPEGIA